MGQLDLAYDYLGEAALVDLHDLHNNVKDGLHMASLAGAWTALNLTKFTINITGAPNLTAIVNGGPRVEIATLDLGNAKIKTFAKKKHADAFRTRASAEGDGRNARCG